MTKRLTSKDCTKCGLCCVAPAGQDVFCNVDTEAELVQLGRYFIQKHVAYPTVFEQLTSSLDGKTQPYALIKTKGARGLGMGLTVCSALKGTPGRKVACSVYDNRPSVCRTVVKPGDRVCLKVRREMGI